MRLKHQEFTGLVEFWELFNGPAVINCKLFIEGYILGDSPTWINTDLDLRHTVRNWGSPILENWNISESAAIEILRRSRSWEMLSSSGHSIWIHLVWKTVLGAMKICHQEEVVNAKHNFIAIDCDATAVWWISCSRLIYVQLWLQHLRQFEKFAESEVVPVPFWWAATLWARTTARRCFSCDANLTLLAFPGPHTSERC